MPPTIFFKLLDSACAEAEASAADWLDDSTFTPSESLYSLSLLLELLADDELEELLSENSTLVSGSPGSVNNTNESMKSMTYNYLRPCLIMLITFSRGVVNPG